MTTILKTKNLIINLSKSSDLDNIHLLHSDSEIMKYLGHGKTYTKDESRIWLEKIISYQNRNGFSFYAVFEKVTNQYVGRAGIIHLGFDEKQSEIEICYALHKKYWNKGYGTEIAKALIQHGLNNLNFTKLVAVTHPGNIASRRILEKSGMRYIKRALYNNIEVSFYNIKKNNTDFNEIKLIPAVTNDLEIIKNLARFYAYDISEFYGDEPGWEMEDDGLYGVGIDFDQYFNTLDCFPFIIRYKNEIAGFAIIDKKGSSNSIDFNMAQFFILRTYKGKHIGKYSAHYCFNKFPGTWEIMVMPGNESAYQFWKSIIRDYTNNNFIEYTKILSHGERNLFKFSSEKNDVD